MCPFSGSPIVAPVSTSQIRIVPSPEPETTFRPSGEYTTLFTILVCPRHIPERAGHDFIRPLYTFSSSGNETLAFLHKSDSTGMDGRPERYMCAALVEIGVRKTSTKRNASSTAL